MLQDTRPAPLDDGGPDLWAEFRIVHTGELLGWLRRLRDSAVTVNLNAANGDALGTTLWSIDDAHGRLNFALGAEPPALAGMVDADEVVAVAYLDNVKLQFDLQDLVVVRSPGATTLQCALPRTLYRFQRRDSFRVRTPLASSPTAVLRHPSLPDMTLALRVIDVSGGGCALLVPNDVPPLQPGSTLAGVRVELDADTRFDAALQLQHVTSLRPEAGGVRIGCAWVDLGGVAARALQRYIDRTQKQRRLLSLD